jgi:hypothetical protein
MNIRQLIDRLKIIEERYGERTWVYVRSQDIPRAMVLLPASMKTYEWSEGVGWPVNPRIEVDHAIVYFEPEGECCPESC